MLFYKKVTEQEWVWYMWLKSLVLIFILAVNVTKIVSSKVCILRLWASSFQTCCSFNVFQGIWLGVLLKGIIMKSFQSFHPPVDREQQDDGNDKEILQQTEVLQSMRPLIVAQHQFCWFGAQMCLVDPGHEQKKWWVGVFFCQLQPLYYFFNFYLEAAAGLTFPEQKGNDAERTRLKHLIVTVIVAGKWE